MNLGLGYTLSMEDRMNISDMIIGGDFQDYKAEKQRRKDEAEEWAIANDPRGIPASNPDWPHAMRKRF